MPSQPRKIAVAYVPVIHRGYLDFFNETKAADLYVIGPDLLKKIDYIRKDLRALKPSVAVKLIARLDLFESVKLLNARTLKEIDKTGNQIILADEDISREVAKSFKKAKVSFYPVFLRWDRRSLERTNKVHKNDSQSKKPADVKLMAKAMAFAGSSSDIWRRVGAILLNKSGKELGQAANQAEPSAHSPWMEGDPRNVFKQGAAIEMSLFMHAEAALIAGAANKGVSLKGAKMYVTTFPCPACAKLIAKSGIKNLYYAEGYGVLDGRRVLDENKVKVVRVSVKGGGEHPGVWTPYNKS